GVGLRISALGENLIQAVRRLSGSRLMATNDCKWVDCGRPADPGLTQGPAADCFFIKSCDYCRV
ncbi:hypothetical protein, partial [Ralstonia sp.]|uniref:hypothetical protein n=1 Tax=Ralstonia sp. TaxID=54061 RepID=UPI002579DF46